MQGEGGKVLAQYRVFRLRLLTSVLAEDAMTGSERLADRFRRMGLADGDKIDAGRRSPHSDRSRRYLAADDGEIGGDKPFHSASIPGTRLVPWLRPRGRRFAEDHGMSVVHYRLSAAFAASLSLAVAACASIQSSEQP